MIKNLLTLLLIMSTCIACNRNQKIINVEGDEYTTKSGKEVAFVFIKHASFEIRYDSLSIQIDPVSNYEPATDYSNFNKADIILVTHEHPDHFDTLAIKTLSSEKTQVVLNQNCAKVLGAGIVMNNGDSIKLRDDITIEAVPAYNTTPDRTKFHPKGRDNGYVLTLDGVRIYIAGDTEDIPEMAQLKDIDIAFLPCNQPYTMTPAQLANAAKMFKPGVVYPYHLSETPTDEIKKLLEEAKIKVKIREMK